MQAQSRSGRPVIFVSILSVLIIIVVAFPILRRSVWRGLTSASKPIAQGTVSLLERAGWPSALRQPTQAETELESQLAALTRQLATARQELQARQTSDQLGAYLQANPFPTVSAAVIGYSPDPGVQSFVINVGTSSGIRTGQAVLTGDGWLVGKIITVHASSSVVLLLTDTQSLILAGIQNSSASQGVVRGERGLTIRMDLIPKNDQIEVGQTVVTSGLEPGIPPDLLIGTIATVEQRSGEVFQRALVTVPIRYGRIRNVAVITQ